MSGPTQDFDRGYLIAVTTLFNTYGQIEFCVRLVLESGISRRRALSLGLDVADTDALRRIYDWTAA